MAEPLEKFREDVELATGEYAQRESSPMLCYAVLLL